MSLRIFQFVVIHTVKGLGVVNAAKVDIFLEFLAFSRIQWILVIWFLISLLFLAHPVVLSSCTGEAQL